MAAGAAPFLLLEKEKQVDGRGAEREEVSGSEPGGAVRLGDPREIVLRRDRLAVQVSSARRAHVDEEVFEG